ncbi:uncharacterized protein LOC134788299 [Penaeus indicus]|uniref:uncharacterized protein LOC134788299 n=1 Tax=Penaeus indicus TaxID=29960 RepID=UPI00300DB69C
MRFWYDIRETFTISVAPSSGFEDSYFFNIGQGVRQGCILLLHLFNVYSEKIIRDALEGFEGSVKVGGRIVTYLRYADDIVLVAGSMQVLETLVELASEQAGLMFNTQKAKVVKMASDPENTEMIETVETFLYLGAIFTNDCNDSADLNRRLSFIGHVARGKGLGNGELLGMIRNMRGNWAAHGKTQQHVNTQKVLHNVEASFVLLLTPYFNLKSKFEEETIGVNGKKVQLQGNKCFREKNVRQDEQVVDVPTRILKEVKENGEEFKKATGAYQQSIQVQVESEGLQ